MHKQLNRISFTRRVIGLTMAVVFLSAVMPGAAYADGTGIPVAAETGAAETRGTVTLAEASIEVHAEPGIDSTEPNAETTLVPTAEVAPTTNLTITNKVTGEFANREKDFDYIIYFTGKTGALRAGESFACKGGVVPGIDATAPVDGVLTLENGGKAEFSLKHGQMIIIEGVPADAGIQIVQEETHHYNAFFTDSEDEGLTFGHDTEIRIAGTSERTFDFVNDMRTMVPSGIEIRSYEAETNHKPAVLFTALLILSGAVVLNCIRRKNGNCILRKLVRALQA